VERPRHRWEDNIITNIKEVEWEGIEWIILAQVRDNRCGVVNSVTNIRLNKM
jgi:hypothetical protein